MNWADSFAFGAADPFGMHLPKEARRRMSERHAKWRRALKVREGMSPEELAEEAARLEAQKQEILSRRRAA